MNNFDNYLNEVFGSFDVCGVTFSASAILKKLDPIVYECYMRDYEYMEEECYEG